MAIEIIEGHVGGNSDLPQKAALFCNTTGWAFGPTFGSYEEAEDFLAFAYRVLEFDPRRAPEAELEELHTTWLKQWREGERHAE